MALFLLRGPDLCARAIDIIIGVSVKRTVGPVHVEPRTIVGVQSII